MLFIAHRGNLNGSNKLENHPDQIDKCLKLKFDSEIDLWVIEKKLFLGHNVGQYSINIKWLLKRRRNLWIHCKNMEALELMTSHELDGLNYFWHENDAYIQTSSGKIWVYPGERLIEGSIAVLPETWMQDNKTQELSLCFGICTDFVFKFQSHFKESTR
jgi:hypothetical protein